MSIDLPKWLEVRYKILWDEFKESPFKFEDAVNVLMEKNKDRWEEIPVYLSELRKLDWLRSELDSKDARKRIYRLRSKEEHVKEILSIQKESLSRGDI